ncbi:translocation/assembly module TamB domain-containing protein [Roseibium sp. RKSG952]|uniref:translocation/assembly module TamB domain-containing protein n=1 Tax=Roseibium sp. RKSG952 TaxID=2529384 RepID=UPI0018AD292B|nr:translocation/assembly module TamB domain-containing protein [Roseibium sp. RKSG952]
MRFVRSVLWVVLIILALPFALLAFLQFPVGQTFVSSVVSSLASSDEREITLSGLKAGFGLDIEFTRLTIADPQGEWLEVDNAALDWTPLDLLSRRVTVDRLVAERISIVRPPAAEPAESTRTRKTGEGGFSMPLGLSVKVDRISVPQLDLGADLAGSEIALAINAAMDVTPSPLTLAADLNVTRIDGVAGEITSTFAFAPADETLRFDIRIQEPRGGLVARAADIQDLPALDVELKGDGPLDDWAANLSVALDGRQTATGSARILKTANARRLTLDLDGQIDPLAPPIASGFVQGTTHLKSEIDLTNAFVPTLVQTTLETQTVKADLSGTYDPESQALSATADILIAAGGDSLIALDIDERRIAAGPLSLKAEANGRLDDAAWSADLSAQTLQTTEGQIGNLTVKAQGQDANFDPSILAVPFQLNVAATDISAADQKLGLLNGNITFTARGLANGTDRVLTLDRAALETPVAKLDLDKTTASLDQIVTSGVLEVPDLASLSGLAGRTLAGSARTSFSADLDPADLTGSGAITLSARDAKTGMEKLDGLLIGETVVSADATLKTLNDIRVTNLKLGANGLTLTGNAARTGEDIQADLSGDLSVLSRLDPRVSGDLAFNVEAGGTLEAPTLSLVASSSELQLSGTPLKNLKAAASATLSKTEPGGSVQVSGDLKGAPLNVTADLVSKDNGAVADPIDFRLASNRLTGKMAIGDLSRALETLDGQIRIDAPDLSELSPLILTEISGALSGDLVARSGSDGQEALKVDLTAQKVTAPGVDIDALTLEASTSALTDTNSYRANVKAGDILAGSTLVKSATITVVPDGKGIKVDATAAMTEGGAPEDVSLSARLEQTAKGAKADLLKLTGRYRDIQTDLVAPAHVVYEDGTASIDRLELKLGSGSLLVGGTAGEKLDFKADLKSIPVALANSVQPGLGLDGTLSGTVTVTGSKTAPKVVWTINGTNLTATQVRDNGLAAVSVNTSGTLENNIITQKTVLDGGNGLGMTASGTVGLKAPGTLDIALDGNAPLAALRQRLTMAGLRGEGSVRIAGKITGSFQKPLYNLTATPTGVRMTSLNTGVTIQDVTGTVSVTPEAVSINQLNGAVASGGSFSAAGTIGLGAGMPADLSAKLDKAKYVDASLVTAVVDADIKVTGDLAGTTNSALISGTVTIDKADISIPETLPGTVSPVIVRHVNAPKAVQQQVAELGGEPRSEKVEGTSNPPRLDVTLNAPGRIFVRGRGLDAELGGNLKIIGTTQAPQAIGAFELRRGLLNILARRLTFSKGEITFSGSLTPVIDFAATSTVSDTTITVSITGNADDPKIAFTSSPDLPQDEVLSLLLFGKSVGTLSPTQIVELATSVAVLTGGSDSGPLAQIRKSLGLDVVDLNIDDDDGPALAVGKYINDNIYLGVEQGTGTGSSRVQVDIELDRGVKLRGEVGADGSSKAGIFIEREY